MGPEISRALYGVNDMLLVLAANLCSFRLLIPGPDEHVRIAVPSTEKTNCRFLPTCVYCLGRSAVLQGYRQGYTSHVLTSSPVFTEIRDPLITYRAFTTNPEIPLNGRC